MIKNPWLWSLASLAIGIDRFSKQWVDSHLASGETMSFLPGFLQLTLTRNTGAAFSLFSGGSDWLKWVSLITSIGLVVYGTTAWLGLWEQFGFGLLLGGAVGNGFDRFVYGQVTDFLELRFIQFPVFNIADIAINLGLICLVAGTLWGNKDDSAHRSAKPGDNAP
jgi:signal peptidase II